ncbi:DUF7738 domain-containing protein [Apibacter adventoris]|uniref:DUF7738 domain-containing protein n=2 Tax=Apibacter adventoris TaxID=1679466 RepID=A0A2S8A8R2_9FLAO|nr:hypothetical protein [Apibacter adventoris]PQL90952.1 hypothetical protein C4S77_08810 [Apibacter adventoris]
MRNKRVLIFLLGFCSFYTQCQTKEPPKPMDTEFTITPCQITYKGKEIPLGKPIDAWVELFGPYSRNFNEHTYIWDSLGVAIFNSCITAYDTNVDKEKRKCDQLYIFFVNLDSKVGQAGKLQFAWQRKSFEFIEKDYQSIKEPMSEELKKRIIGRIEPKEKYIYPFTPYTQTVNLQGAPVKSGMSLNEVNKERSKIKGLEKMGYWDNDGDWSWDSGSTTIKTGEFREQKDHSSICPNQDYWYYITLRYSEGELEYLKVEYLSKENEK